MTDRSKRLVAVEDDPRFRASLEKLFAHAEGLDLVSTFGSAYDLLEELDGAERSGRRPRWDLVLMDLELPGMDGIEATRRLKERLDTVKIVVLTVFEEPDTVLEAICAGADGYLLKRHAGHDLVEEIDGVFSAGAPLTAGVAKTVVDLVRRQGGDEPGHEPPSPSRLDLTEREQEVLRHLSRGLAYKQVAGRLDISIDTVRSHVRSIYDKLQVHSVAEAVSRAIRERLI